MQPVGDAVVLKLHAQGVLGGAGIAVAQRRGPGAAGVHAQRGAPVGLAKLVAVDRVVQKIGEVGKQVQPVSDDVRIDLSGCVARGVVSRLPPRPRKAVAAGLATIGLVDRVKPAQQASVYRALWNLVGGMPFGIVGHQRDVEAIGLGALAVTQYGIAPAVVVTHGERAIIFEQFHGVQQVAIADFGRIGQQRANKPVASQANAGNALGQRVGVCHVERPSRRKIAFGGVKRALSIVQ